MEGLIHILVLDDDKEELEIIKWHFDKAGVTNYRMFTTAEAFFQNFSKDVYLAILDYHLDGGTAAPIADRIQELNKERGSIAKCQVIIISGTEDIRVPVYFMNSKRADFFILKDNKGSFYFELVVYARKAIDQEAGWADLENHAEKKKEFYNSLTIPDERK